MNLDKWLPILVGHRTELLGIAMAVLQLLGIFGVIDRGSADDASRVIGGGAIATFAAKVNRTSV